MNSSVSISPTSSSGNYISDHPRHMNNNNHINDLMAGNNNYASNQFYRYNNLSSNLQNSNQNNSATLTSNNNNRVPITTAATIKTQIASPYHNQNSMLSSSPYPIMYKSPPTLQPNGQLAVLQPLPPPKPPYSAQTGLWQQSQQQPHQHVAAASQNWRDYSSVTPPQTINNNNNLWRTPQINSVTSQQHRLRSPYFMPSNTNQLINSQRQPLTVHNQHYPVRGSWQPSRLYNNTNSNLHQFNSAAPSTLSESRQSNEPDNEDGDDSTSNTDQDSDPDPDAEAVVGGQESSSPSESSQDEASNPSEDPEQVNRELEEQNGQRSFSEDQTDANERDRDGNIIVTHRKHLINGRPVKDKGSDTSESSRGDFDKISGEIDDDNTMANDYYDDTTEAPSGDSGGQNYQQQQESRQRRVIHKPQVKGGASKGLLNLDKPIIGVNKTLSRQLIDPPRKRKRLKKKKSKDGGKKLKPIDPTSNFAESMPKKNEMETVDPNSKDPVPKDKERESHEHRMKESLTAQHWDDDAASSPQAKAKQDQQEQEQQEANDEEQEHADQTENQQATVEEPDEGQEEPEDTGPQKVDEELKELDMTVDPDRFMQSDSRRRRKREVSSMDLNNTLATAGDIEAEKLDANNTTIINKNDTISSIVSKPIDDEQEANISSVDNLDGNKTTTTTTHSKPSGDIVSGQEDINVEVIADPNGGQQPLPPVNNDYHNGQSIMSGGETGDNSNQMTATGFETQIDNQAPVLDQATYNSFYNSINQPNQEPAPPLEPGDLAHNTGNNQQQLTGGANNQFAYQHSDQTYDEPYQNNRHHPKSYPLDYHSTAIVSNSNQRQPQPAHHHELDEPASDALIGPIPEKQPNTGSSFALNYPLQASSSKSKKKKMKKKKFKKSKMTEAKYKAAKAIAMKKKSKSRKGK